MTTYQNSKKYLDDAINVIKCNLPNYNGSLQRLLNSCNKILNTKQETWFPIKCVNGKHKWGKKITFMFTHLTEFGFRTKPITGIPIQDVVDVLQVLIKIKYNK
jgi:hypothetical protein